MRIEVWGGKWTALRHTDSLWDRLVEQYRGDCKWGAEVDESDVHSNTITGAIPGADGTCTDLQRNYFCSIRFESLVWPLQSGAF